MFSVDLNTGVETVLYSFCKMGCADGAEPFGGLIDVKGTLYGTTSGGGANGRGTVFSFDPSTGAEKVLYSFIGGADGAYPQGGLIDVSGTLYGTTTMGGAYSKGTVFALEKKKH